VLGESRAKYASLYLPAIDREFQVSAKRLVGVIAVIFSEFKMHGAIEEIGATNLSWEVGG